MDGHWRIVEPATEAWTELTAGRGATFDQWLAAWDRLSPAERAPFSHPIWLAAWLAHRAPQLSADRRLFVYEADGRVRGAAPFAVESLAPAVGRCRLRHDDDGTLEGASLALASDRLEGALAALWQVQVPRRGRPAGLQLGKVDGPTPWIGSGGARTQPRGKRSTLDVSGGWEGVEARLGKNFRGNLRKARNRLNKAGGAQLDVLTDLEGLEAGFERLQDLEERSWKGRAGSTIRHSPPMQAFLLQALRGLAARGEIVIHVLRGTEGDLAAQYGLLLDGTLHVVKIGYDESNQRLAPGNLLLERTIQEDLAARGVTCVSLVTDQPWHEKWRPEPITTHFVDWAAPGMAGGLARLAQRRFKSEARRALERWRQR